MKRRLSFEAREITRSWSNGLLVLAAILMGVGAPSRADEVVALHNPGFEASEVSEASGWTLDPASTGAIELGVDSGGGAHSGARSLRVASVTSASVVVASSKVTLQVGHLYRLSGWIRTHDVRSDPAAKYPTAVPACLSMESFPFTNHSPAVGADSTWTKVETLFIATRSSDRVRLHLGHNGAATGEAFFDDIRLEKVDDISALIPLETVRWAGDGYRYDDQGWIFVHVEGEPYDRGHQYGTLVADEIVEYISKLAIQANEKDPGAGWQTLRFECDTLFLRGYDEEFLTEMKGIADGAAKAGAKYNDRKLDLLDIVTINSVIDLGQLHDAIQVTPHALTGESFLGASEELKISERNHKCSAFAATGPATADGQIVFGQLFMWSGFTGVHWNVICDLQPAKGHRLVYHTFPGGIHSGADFYINSAGIVIGETTVAQTPYEPKSTPQSNRIRKAAQYASSIDDVERILWEGNNGMYTNDWPIADIKTGEAAILLLGTHRKKMWRTSENMSPFGTPGFLWSNNNNRDAEVRKEYVAHPEGRPFDLAFSAWNRDIAFNEFYQKYKGQLDSTTAVAMWASSPLNRAHACDGKITTSEMAKELAFLAHYGKVTLREKFPQKDNRIMPDLPGAIPHLSLGYSVVSPVFVTDRLKDVRAKQNAEPATKPEKRTIELGELKTDFEIETEKLWRRTVYPATSAENWFVSASAGYWRLLNELEKGKEEKSKDKVSSVEKFSNELAALNRRYLYTVSRENDLPAVAGEPSYVRFGPYQIPRIKGTFALHQLRLLTGTEVFLKIMRAVHERFDGTPMTNADLLRIVDELADPNAARLIDQWIQREGLPEVEPTFDIRQLSEKNWEVRVEVRQSGEPYRAFTHVIVDGEKTRHVRRMEISGPISQATLSFDERPARIEFNAFNDFPTANPNYYVWNNLLDDFDEAIIVYGTARQDEANHTLARRWQERLADAFLEILPPLVKDSELTEEQVANHDLIVMGTLRDNYLFQDSLAGLPVTFGRNHFTWRGVSYDAPDDGLFLVVPNPFNAKRVMYVIAANSALQLHHMTKKFNREIASWALFKGEKIEEQGYHILPEFEHAVSPRPQLEDQGTIGK